MKHTICILLILSLFFAGCRKYEDGPSISFRTKEKRLIGSWLCENENRKTMLSFEKNGIYQESDYSSDSFMFSKTGSWQWADKKEKILLDWTLERTNGFYYVDSNGNVIPYTDSTQIHIIIPSETNYKIYRLTMKELWIGDETAIEFKCTKQ
jgi:hypothetical protein